MIFGYSQFPEENVDPAEKLKPWYGAAYAKAMLYHGTSLFSQMFYGAADKYKNLEEFAQGSIDTDRVKKLFSFYSNTFKDQATQESFSYIDATAVNLATKYVNIAVGKLNGINYDMSLTPIDPLAIDKQREFENKLKVYKELKGFMDSIGIKAKDVFQGIDFEAIAAMPDEQLAELSANPKLQLAMDAEMTIKLAHRGINNWTQIRRNLAFDIVTMGVGINLTYRDKNGYPKEKRIHPNSFICSAPEDESFDNLEYAGHIEFISPSQFRREASPYLSQDRIDEITRTYGVFSNNAGLQRQAEGYDGLGMIPIFRYQFLSENIDKFVVRRNGRGNKTMRKKKRDYVIPDSEKHFYESGEKELIENTYTSKYSGSLIIGTDFVFGHDVSDTSSRQRTSLVNEKLNYFVHAPNMRNGKVVSTLEQIIEPIFMANVAWTRMKKIVGKGWMGAREINFTELEKVSMGHNGAVWTPRQVLRLFQQEEILIKRGNINPYGQANGRAVEDINIGLTMTDLFNTFTTAIQQIRDTIGINEYTDASTPPTNALNGVMEMAQENTNVALDYLFHAMKSIYDRTSLSFIPLVQQSVREGKKIYGIVEALGRGTAQYYEVNKDIAFHDFALVSEQVTQADWNRLHNMVESAVARGDAGKGGIMPSDAAFIYQIDNLKQAYQVLITSEKRTLAIQEQQAEAAHQRAMELSTENSKMAHENKMAELKETERIELGKIAETHKGRIIELNIEGKWDVETAKITAEANKERTRQQGMDNIIRDAQKEQNKPKPETKK